MTGGLVPARRCGNKGAVVPSLAAPRRLIAAIVRAPIDYALPPRCPGCGTIVGGDHVFCLSCWQSLDFLGGPACAVCAEPLALALHDDARCGACLADPPPFDAMRAAVAYGPIARTLALKLKYGRRPGIAVTMARAMRRRARDLLDGAIVAPVPLHRWRLWERGYNQAMLIARALVAESTATLAPDLLARTRATQPMRGLSPAARARAVAGAIAIDSRWRSAVAGRRVVLVDDVYTTGATARACARVLRRAGAAHIAILCWARVTREGQDVR